ncbi:hypothetical protein BR93DRAFT_834105 [Coniochaeta sp. PMI_546]|nr:hypothetical protein BR93DRAFT_834105 [Coniochaeta sp. PMI_546]
MANISPQAQNTKPAVTCESESPEPILDTIYVRTSSPSPVRMSQNNAFVGTQPTRARLIRVRVDKVHQIIYSADDATGTRYKHSARPILFGGPLSRFTSRIFMSMQRDFIYIDEPIDVPLSVLTVLAVSGDPSPIERIAINIDRVPLSDIRTLAFAADNEALSSLTLVISCDSFYASSDDVVDDWGFKQISEKSLALGDRQRYKRGQEVLAAFNFGQVPGIDYSFVVEAGTWTE